jgi:hypothetical protein
LGNTPVRVRIRIAPIWRSRVSGGTYKRRYVAGWRRADLSPLTRLFNHSRHPTRR